MPSAQCKLNNSKQLLDLASASKEAHSMDFCSLLFFIYLFSFVFFISLILVFLDFPLKCQVICLGFDFIMSQSVSPPLRLKFLTLVEISDESLLSLVCLQFYFSRLLHSKTLDTFFVGLIMQECFNLHLWQFPYIINLHLPLLLLNLHI